MSNKLKGRTDARCKVRTRKVDRQEEPMWGTLDAGDMTVVLVILFSCHRKP